MLRDANSNRSTGGRHGGTVALLCAASLPAVAQEPAPGFADPLLGRWDLTIESAAPYPSWLEVRLRTERELMARFVGRLGSVRHASDVQFANGRLTFTVPVQYEPGGNALDFEGRLAGDELQGTTHDETGAVVRWTGRRAPALRAAAERTPGAERALFNGRDLSGWQPRSAEHPGCWTVADGELVATPPCVDLVTDEAFDDFTLHAELVFPAGSNSGIYLRGRYEVQIADDAGKALDPLRMGAIYGFIVPSVDAARPADEWQTLDVTLRGRFVTVILNGITIIDAQEIPGITGGALDSRESAPGPIMLQGDHGPIRFRNLTLRPHR